MFFGEDGLDASNPPSQLQMFLIKALNHNDLRPSRSELEYGLA